MSDGQMISNHRREPEFLWRNGPVIGELQIPIWSPGTILPCVGGLEDARPLACKENSQC